ncbi:transcriptional regulator with XRE-family HTH domain [Rhizomicrobium palustre]|uniref:Transcriptional regulator with XRE-family HTH domain n=1 Tax=Rhizomicrobium palustre TaxID=189966 RepID=A0A846MZN2_9PROT|nr:helix-turn-helix transcriptional regulator [Rhizomicrobium palustre]NIK88397.1 transcriptional regulator with XRE-family HTH domain [Rhizomicrobium palustre]
MSQIGSIRFPTANLPESLSDDTNFIGYTHVPSGGGTEVSLTIVKRNLTLNVMSAAPKPRNHNLSKRTSDTDVLIGSRLRLWRRTMDVDACALAAKIGITYQQLQKYEKGMNRISASRLFTIAKVLDVPIEYFYRDVALAEPGGEAVPHAEQISLLANGAGTDVLRHYLTIPKPEVRKALLALMRSLVRREADAPGTDSPA